MTHDSDKRTERSDAHLLSVDKPEMKSESRGVAVARAHVTALYEGDSTKIRSLLADDVHYIVLTTIPNMPMLENTGVENFMRDIMRDPNAIDRGSARIVYSAGDDHRALFVVTFESSTWASSGPSGTNSRWVAARHYMIDGSAKIQTEQVILFPLGGSTKAWSDNSDAVSVAEAHVEAFARRDYDEARRLLADDVHYTVLTTLPGRHSLDNTGPYNFMQDLTAFAEAIIPGSTHVLASIGDDRRALVVMTYEAPFGPNGTRIRLVGARHYLIDENRKVKTEQVIFFPLMS